ncbi:OmpH family outer membrane protein [Phycisphaerales bacterium AB-hyl4]|uniref:OmpH family outer membrane protein n=1 Tax=Natronomicrosphaera hydrolytica TaxID=3242702 RepID=A0ABV4U1H7_9BACT
MPYDSARRRGVPTGIAGPAVIEHASAFAFRNQIYLTPCLERSMRLSRLTVSIFALAFVLVGIAGVVTANNALRADPTAIAVVNIEHAFNELREKVAVENEIRSRGEQLGQEEQQRRQQIRQLREDLDVLAAGTSAYRQKEEELGRAVIELQTWTQFQQQRLAREHVLQTERLYRKMNDAIAELAQDEGYDAVLFREGEINFQAEQPQELVAQIQMRKVLYASDNIDITQQLIQRMNNAYEAQ